MRLSRGGASLAFFMSALAVLARPAAALPPGRAWATWENLAHPRLIQSGTPRLEVDSTGNPIMFIASRWDTSSGGPEWTVFKWNEDGWQPYLLTGLPADYFPDPVLSLDGRHYLMWISLFPNGPVTDLWPLLFAPIYPTFSMPETTLITLDQTSEYGGAVSLKRRWVVRSQQIYPFSRPIDTRFIVRTVYSDTGNIWHELPQLGVDEFMCTIAPISDYSAMVVYGDVNGLRWARVDGEQWTEQGVIDPRGGLHPRLRVSPSGALWLLWTSGLHRKVYFAQYRNGSWQAPDSTIGIHPGGQTFASAWCDISRDPGEKPVIAWIDQGFGYTYRDIASIAFPTESGWSPGEEVPGSDGPFGTPRITRDRNGDTWVAWRLKSVGLARFNHTYVSATASPPVVTSAGRNRVVSWTLSGPAPESWWAVLRARNDGPFEQVARVEANSDLLLSWADASPPAGVLRYRIRRESVDSRYRWESEDGFWPPKSQRGLMLAQGASASAAAGDLELSGADTGAFEIKVYDLQGRVVLTQQGRSTGTGRDPIHLDFGARTESLPNGIYFASVHDASGRTTNPLKLVILR